MSTKNTLQDGVKKKKKKRTKHHKSRNGCLECKRRRVKCDETKPSCLRCALGLQKCKYAAFPQPVQDEFEVPSRSTNMPSPSPSPLIRSSSLITSPLPSHAPSSCSTHLSDTELYIHYLQHTSRTLSLSCSDNNIVHIDMPTLAYQSSTIFHALLAVSAASLAWTMIYKSSCPDIATVQETMLTGYHYYNLASQQMRDAIADPDTSKQEALVASVILVPFAAGSQQINHWISSRTGESLKLLSSTPRDVIILIRGIRTMLRSLDYVDLCTNPNLTAETALAPASSRTHVMREIIASTSAAAFSTLQVRLNSLCYEEPALETAFEILETIRNRTLKAPDDDLPDWAADMKPHPTEPRTRRFLTFLSQVPQEYLDIVLPLLDQRLERPIYASPAVLTPTQALALDIYAHWSVLMFLVEDESWFIGDLPAVTLKGMIYRYGEGFVGTLWSREVTEKQKWWPGSMLRIWEDVKSYR